VWADAEALGPHKAFQIARDSATRRVIWVTDLHDPAYYLLESARSVGEALARLSEYLVPGARVGVMPYANATIPALLGIGRPNA
jgi:predicted Rossmann-fold nucleotide-binding protein